LISTGFSQDILEIQILDYNKLHGIAVPESEPIIEGQILTFALPNQMPNTLAVKTLEGMTDTAQKSMTGVIIVNVITHFFASNSL
jgi:hypothetical protein